MIWALAALAWVEAQASGFAPVLDRPYREVSEEVRPVAGQPRRFTAEHRILFHRDREGLVAEVTLVRLSTDAPAEVARLFLLGSGGLKDRTVRFRLAADGSMTGIDDEAAVWAAVLAGFAAVAPPAGSAGVHSALTRDPARALAALPPEQRRGMIASPIAGLCGDPAALPPVGERAVTLPGHALTGTSVPLAGTETAAMLPGGMLRVVTVAADERSRIVRTRTVDRSTGLLVGEEEERFTTVAGRSTRVGTTRRSVIMVS